MASSEAEKAKADGSAAYQREDFQAAVTNYGKAIEFGGDKDFLRVIYSNRSAAYLSMKQNDKALADAKKCTEIDPQWAKGHIRVGDAFFAMRRFVDAYNAYNSGLRLTPSDASLKVKLEKATLAIQGESRNSSRSTPSASIQLTSTLGRYLNLATIGLFVAYLIPLGARMNGMAYRLCAATTTVDNLLGIYKRYGMPKFSSEYVTKVAPDPAIARLMLAFFVVFSSRPYFFVVAPMVITSMITFLPDLFQYARDNARTLEERVLPMVARYVPSLAQINMNQLFSSSLIPQFTTVLHRLAAQAEVTQGIIHIIELLLPTRSILLFYLWWQYLKLRYMQEGSDGSAPLHVAFTDIHRTINGLLANAMVPAIVRTGYGYIAMFLAKQVQLPTREERAAGGGGGISSMLSKCTIM